MRPPDPSIRRMRSSQTETEAQKASGATELHFLGKAMAIDGKFLLK